jgi:hypothetical protein
MTARPAVMWDDGPKLFIRTHQRADAIKDWCRIGFERLAARRLGFTNPSCGRHIRNRDQSTKASPNIRSDDVPNGGDDDGGGGNGVDDGCNRPPELALSMKRPPPRPPPPLTRLA